MSLLNAMAALAEHWDDVQRRLETAQFARLRDLVAQFAEEDDPDASADIAEDIMDLLMEGLPVTHPVLQALADSRDRSSPAADNAWLQLAPSLRARLAGTTGTSFGDSDDL